MGKAVTINYVSLKAKYKEDVFRVLSYEGGMYLPFILDLNKEYIKEISTGNKNVFIENKYSQSKYLSLSLWVLKMS